MKCDIQEVYEFILSLNKEYGGELNIELDECIIRIKHDVNEYCFFFNGKLVYVRPDEELVCDSLEDFIKYVEENKEK